MPAERGHRFRVLGLEHAGQVGCMQVMNGSLGKRCLALFRERMPAITKSDKHGDVVANRQASSVYIGTQFDDGTRKSRGHFDRIKWGGDEMEGVQPHTRVPNRQAR